jgi:hypothetical protein
MIKIEINNIYKKIYSDLGFRIKKIGTEEIYDEAIDSIFSDFNYEETNILIEVYDDKLKEDY